MVVAEARATRLTLGYWRNSVLLWRHVVEMAPLASTAHNGLGTALQEESNTDDAQGNAVG